MEPREIPDLDSIIAYPLFGSKIAKTKENYLTRISEYERGVEKSIIEAFNYVDIRGTVKTIPESLPYKHEIVVTLKGESYMNGPYEVKRVIRPILKELLSKDIRTLRFYMRVNIISKYTNLLDSYGKIEYRFRYY